MANESNVLVLCRVNPYLHLALVREELLHHVRVELLDEPVAFVGGGGAASGRGGRGGGGRGHRRRHLGLVEEPAPLHIGLGGNWGRFDKLS